MVCRDTRFAISYLNYDNLITFDSMNRTRCSPLFRMLRSRFGACCDAYTGAACPRPHRSWRPATLQTDDILKSVENGQSGGSLSAFSEVVFLLERRSAARTTTFCQWQADAIQKEHRNLPPRLGSSDGSRSNQQIR